MKELGHLVFTMKEGSAVKIGENVEIVVMRAQGSWTKLLFIAPKDIRITKQEPSKKKDS